MQTRSSHTSRGYLIALAATLLWSFTGILISYLSRTFALPSLILAFWRDFALALGLALFFLAFTRGRFRLARRHWPLMALYGLVLAVFNSSWTFSVQFNGAAVATVLGFSSPALTAILSRWILKERLNLLKWISIGLSLAGIILVSNVLNADARQVNAGGIAFGLVTGLAFAFYNLMGKSASNRSIDSWTALLYSFGGAAVFLFFFNLTFDAFSAKPLLGDMLWLGGSTWGWAVLIFLGVGPTLGGFGLYTLSLNDLPATVANLIASLEPALTAIWAFFIFGEQLTGPQLVGGALVLAGVILLRAKE